MGDATIFKRFARSIATFLLTHPMGDATFEYMSKRGFSAFLLTHPMGDATSQNGFGGRIDVISTHASHGGCDP